jgi:membrane protease YdiL (CAAX protease family)
MALAQESWELICVAAATGIMAWWERRRFLSFGFIDAFAWIRLVSGAAWGLICLSTVIGCMSQWGFIVFEHHALDGWAAWRYAFAWALVCLIIGIFEESLLRGYLQQTLARAMGFWPAAWLLSIAFALWHLSNGGESLFGLIVVGLGGLVFCLSLWYTKSLWWAVGFHAGWDWGQSYFYGTPDSGLVTEGHLFTTHPSGNPLWSGGSTGPEGSLCMLPLLLLMAFGMWLWWGRLARPRHGAGSGRLDPV